MELRNFYKDNEAYYNRQTPYNVESRSIVGVYDNNGGVDDIDIQNDYIHYPPINIPQIFQSVIQSKNLLDPYNIFRNKFSIPLTFENPP